MIFLKSKLYREEIKHWGLIVLLLTATVVATMYASANKDKTLIIAIDDSGSRLVTDNKDQILQTELKQFVKYFLDQYYTYNDQTFSERMGIATELMSTELWDKEKVKLSELKEKLLKSPLTQFSEIENVDLVASDKVEAILKIKITSRMNQQNIKLKVTLEFKKNQRSEKNPWNYQIMDVSDAVL